MVNRIAAAERKNDLVDARAGFDDLVASYRHFVNRQMDTLRRWQAAIARLAHRQNLPLRTYDIPLEGKVLLDQPIDWEPADE